MPTWTRGDSSVYKAVIAAAWHLISLQQLTNLPIECAAARTILSRPYHWHRPIQLKLQMPGIGTTQLPVLRSQSPWSSAKYFLRWDVRVNWKRPLTITLQTFSIALLSRHQQWRFCCWRKRPPDVQLWLWSAVTSHWWWQSCWVMLFVSPPQMIWVQSMAQGAKVLFNPLIIGYR